MAVSLLKLTLLLSRSRVARQVWPASRQLRGYHRVAPLSMPRAAKADGSVRVTKPAKATQVKVEAEPAAEAAVAVVATTPKRRARKKAVAPAEPVEPPKPFNPADVVLAPRPVPILGYCCLNVNLRYQKPASFTNRDCILRTFNEKGLTYISELALANVRDLAAILHWNHEHGVRLFRLTSNFFPWSSKYKLEDLPDYPAIAETLREAGIIARAYDQRLTAHPSQFVKLACPDNPTLVEESLGDLELHSKVFDLMGYEPSHYNKINIHIGGTYGDKDAALDRFAKNFERLSDRCKARLAVENDDRDSMFSVRDLLVLHERTGIPITFDFHHHRFCPGGMTEQEAFEAAIATWPPGIRPIVHWSESQEGRKAHAHSDYVKGPIFLHGREAEVDVMIEAKAKELALLLYRDGSLAFAPDDLQPVEGMPGSQAEGAGPATPSTMIRIPSGDKRLQARSHAKYKPKGAAATADAEVEVDSDGEKPLKRRRSSKTAAAAAAAAAISAVKLEAEESPPAKPVRKRSGKAAAIVATPAFLDVGVPQPEPSEPQPAKPARKRPGKAAAAAALLQGSADAEGAAAAALEAAPAKGRKKARVAALSPTDSVEVDEQMVAAAAAAAPTKKPKVVRKDWKQLAKEAGLVRNQAPGVQRSKSAPATVPRELVAAL